MWKKYCLILILLPFVVSAQSWEWAKNYGTSSPLLIHSGQSISRDGQNNIYVTGFSWSPSEATYTGYAFNWLKKFDPDGNVIWSDTIPFYTPDTKNITDEVGNSYVLGNGKIVKYNSAGVLVWEKQTSLYLSDFAFSKNGLIVIGFAHSNTTLDGYSVPSQNSILSEWDDNGQILWLTTYPNYGALSARVANNGEIFVIGSSPNPEISNAVRIFDNTGTLIRSFIKTKYPPRKIFIDNENNFYVYEDIASSLPLIIDDDTIFTTGAGKCLIKFNKNGERLWYKIIKKSTTIDALLIDNENNVYIGGNILDTLQVDSFLLENKAGGAYVAKFKADGTVAWLQYSQQVIPTAPGQLTDMILDSDNNPLITGAITYKHTFGSITVTGHNNLYSDALIAKINQPRSVSPNEPPINPSIGLYVYPNPTGGAFSVSYQTDKATSISVIIRNELGQIILKKEYGNKSTLSETFDLSYLAKGMYFIQVNTDSAVEVRKIMIE